MDRHTALWITKGAATLVALWLMVHYWTGRQVPASANLFLNAAIPMCLGLVLLAERLIDEPGLRGVALAGGFAGLVGIAIATL